MMSDGRKSVEGQQQAAEMAYKKYSEVAQRKVKSGLTE